jgi:hypothetical protein
MKSIKSYLDFLKEDNNDLAEEIISLAEGDSYAQTLISKYCKEFDTSVDAYSIISILDKNLQKEILQKIKEYKSKKEEDPEVFANTDLNLLESNSVTAGKNLFSCFLKMLTALGCKNIQVNPELTPPEYLVYLVTNDLNYLDIRMVSSRFKYLDMIILNMQTSTQIAKLYYGIRNDMVMEYGLTYQDTTHKIGEFKFKFETYESLINSPLLALFNLKTHLKNFNYEKLKIFGKIKKAMNNFNPGYFEKKSKPTIKEDIMTFGYYGIGRWDDGFMDHNEIQSVKNNLKNYLIQFPWSEQLQLSIVAKEYWLYINIKLK